MPSSRWTAQLGVAGQRGSPTVTYRKLLRTINLPSTGAHTVTVIASLPRGRELALDAYGIAR